MRTPQTPSSEADVFRLATGYLARRAASKLQLRRYLLRKFGRAPSEEADPGTAGVVVEAVLARLERLGLIDEIGLAQSRARTLTAKGFSGRRLRTHLKHQGFDVADPALGPALDVTDEAQAERYAERKRLGPYATQPHRSSLDRDVRSLVRAGFSADLAVRVMRRLRAAIPEPAEQPDPDVNAG